MLGIDLTTISRFKKVNKRFIQKILSDKEINEYQKSKDKAKFLASHWAIKEALYKADNSLSSFNKIEITKKNRKYLYPGYIITTTTEGDYYFAQVMKEQQWQSSKD